MQRVASAVIAPSFFQKNLFAVVYKHPWVVWSHPVALDFPGTPGFSWIHPGRFFCFKTRWPGKKPK
jgi:hypothetical protein